MNKYFLTFKSSELEEQYQQSQLQQVRFKFYLCVASVCFFMNLFIVISNFISPTTNTWQINACFATFSLLEIICHIIMKHFKYIQITMTLTNIMVGLLELNIDPASTTQTEFFAYGNTFMQFQGIVYLLSDFHYSIIQLIGQLVARQAITTIVSQRFDFVLFGTQIIAAILIGIATYMRNKTGRIFYMQSLKNTYFDQLSPFLITEPFVKIKLSGGINMMFHITQNNGLHLFPGYDEDLCFGCNIRNLLRKYELKPGQYLEKQLITKDFLELPAKFQISYQRKLYQLRICRTDFIETSYLIILESAQSLQMRKSENIQEERKLKVFLKKRNSFHQKFMTWGILSVVLLNSRLQHKIDLRILLEKFLRIYQREIWQKLKVRIFNESEENDLFTFLHQLQIFLIQFYDTLMIIQHQKKTATIIKLANTKNYIEMQIENLHSETILNLLKKNYFFQKTQRLLVHQTLVQSDCLIFRFKKFSKQSFFIQST